MGGKIQNSNVGENCEIQIENHCRIWNKYDFSIAVSVCFYKQTGRPPLLAKKKKSLTLGQSSEILKDAQFLKVGQRNIVSYHNIRDLSM